ncbi:MAG: NYN domain-containing protein [Sphaerochaetaceae bacterium]|jgi:uncharacterized LabA/DUF88 family protein
MSKNMEWERIAVLIDADNAQLSKLKLILDEISAQGRIVVKKAYGNWKDERLKNWERTLNSLAIKPEQQFDYTKGKNATDISLTIGAMDLLSTGLYDAFVLVSSDSDFTPLAIRLRESGVAVLGVGEKKTPGPFKNACDEFILTENLGKGPGGELETAAVESDDDVQSETEREGDIDYIHGLLKIAWDKYQDADGWVNVSAAGTYIKRVKPDFDTKTYGFSKLPSLVMAFPDRYEWKKAPGKGTVKIFSYRLKGE